MLLPLCLLPPAGAAERTTLSLDGEWEMTDSKAPEPPPAAWAHKGPVPGLAHSAAPAFPDVDQFESRQLIQNRVSKGLAPRSALVQNAGVSRQARDWFWYRRAFDAPARRQAAILRINKAQFGAAVWLNGKKIGEHLPCFSAAIFDVTDAIRWSAANQLVVRVGAHPGVLPPEVNAGTDFEKNRWTPGIYDSVSVQFSDNPVIETIQVAPRLAASSIVVETVLRNAGTAPAAFRLTQRVHPWREAGTTGAAPVQSGTLAPRERRTVRQEIPLKNPKLWWPEDPNLYVLETGTGGDTASTRFGMRELRFDTPTRRAWLNGRVYFLRGSNITLHRFFEDPLSGRLPWNEAWVRKLLVEIPKQMHWNSFRFCIGPAPDRWLDIADEAGLLIQNEYFIWHGRNWHDPGSQARVDVDQTIREYKEWMRDNWNHPSVVIWDANNETWNPLFGEQIIPAVRGLDLSNRPWENSYNPPAGPDDPVEDHPYEHYAMAMHGTPFDMATLERPDGKAPIAPSGHALILNEYGWLWLNRDGSPTELTKKLYPLLLGENNTAAARLEMNAYLLAGLTEYWRAYRHHAAVMHFVYLMSSDPLGYTADHFRDVEKLELHPAFREYVSHAFAPLGVYLSFWQPTLKPGSTRELQVMLVNDEPRPAAGKLRLVLERQSGERLAEQAVPFTVGALGQQTYYVDFRVPEASGECLLRAIAEPAAGEPTISRRKVTLAAKK